MLHDHASIDAAKADPRPRSAVSIGVGVAGLAGMVLWLAVARVLHMDGPYAALVNVAACAVPMILWSLLVDKVHRNASTGIDWALRRPWRESWDVSVTKLTGLWVTWGGIAAIYVIGRFWWDTRFADYPFAMGCLLVAAPILLIASVPYVLWLDRRLIEPRDGAWHFGAWLMGLDGVDRDAIANHLRSWAVKGFFLAFMLAVLPGGFAQLVGGDWSGRLRDPVALTDLLVTAMFVVDVAFATAGYVLTFRPLDSHIRSANPYAAAWTAALICYPPFVLMNDGNVLDYRPGGAEWPYWLAGYPWAQAALGAVLVLLTGIYAWSTVAFGLRFSNLTHRGILTHGPYAWSRHPAYLSKNLFWWLSTLPFLATSNWHDAVRNTALLAVVSGVYYWRAKTEERHLRADPTYQDYERWIVRCGAIPRLFSRFTARPGA